MGKTQETKQDQHYDYNAENYKVCPVCGKVIDYHVDGFIHDQAANKWACRDHTPEELKEAGFVDTCLELMKSLTWYPLEECGNYFAEHNGEIFAAPMLASGGMDYEEAGSCDDESTGLDSPAAYAKAKARQAETAH